MPLFYTEIDNFSIHYVIETSRARAQQGEGHHRDGRAGRGLRAAALGLAGRQVTPWVPSAFPTDHRDNPMA